MPRRVLVSSLMLFSTFLPSVVHSQTAAESTLQIDAGDARAFNLLFRRTAEHLKRAQASASSDDPDSQLRLTLPTSLDLTPTQAQQVEESAADWASDSAPIRDQLLSAIAQYQSARPNGGNPAQLSSIKDIRLQLDRITLEYRDELCATMTPSACRHFEAKIRHFFNKTEITDAQGDPESGSVSR